MIYISIITILVIGTLLHFLYEFSGHNKYIALVAAVNESTWEHFKMSLTPMFLFSLVDGFIYGTNANYFVAKFISLCFPLFFMLIFFYAYQIISKRALLVLDIIIYMLSVIFGEMLFYKIIEMDSLSFSYTYLSIVGIFTLFTFYLIFTVLPLENFLFKDPVTKEYGIEGHPEHDEVWAFEKAEKERVERERKRRRRRHNRKKD